MAMIFLQMRDLVYFVGANVCFAVIPQQTVTKRMEKKKTTVILTQDHLNKPL